MASVLLIIAIVAMGLIVFWYVFDEAARGGQAKSGLLGMSEPREASPKSSGPGWRGGGSGNSWRPRPD